MRFPAAVAAAAEQIIRARMKWAAKPLQGLADRNSILPISKTIHPVKEPDGSKVAARLFRSHIESNSKKWCRRRLRNFSGCPMLEIIFA